MPKLAAMVDANLNRFREGCRVLEDIARFLLEDEDLFLEIKYLKKQIQIKPIDRTKVVDIGGPAFKENQNRNNLIDLVNANALRMQEAARALEEIDNRVVFKKIRFLSYEIHSKILNKINIFIKSDKLHGIYPICDPQKHSIENIIHTLLEQKITICQVRAKSSSVRDIIQFTSLLKSTLSNTLIIINDHLDIALGYADGVHLGQHDFPLERAKKLAPEDFIIGVTCHTLNEALCAEKAGASYISVGCLFLSQTKQDTIPVSLSEFEKISQAVSIPVCAIGGIQPCHYSQLKEAGADLIALQSGFWDKLHL